MASSFKVLLLVISLFIISSYAEEPPAGGDFCLQAMEGERCLSDFNGDVVLLYFGYMTCPDVCPTSLSILSQAFQGLDAQTKNSTHVLFVTLDPDRDGLLELNAYLTYFNPRFIGLTGDIVDIKQVADRYGAQFQKVSLDSVIGYAIDHSAAVYLIDGKGKWLGQFKHLTSPQDIVDGIVYAHQHSFSQ